MPISHPLLRNALFNSFSWGVQLVVNIIAVPVLVTYLGVEGFGLYALMTGFLGYFSLLDLGVSQASVKFISEYAARESNDDIVETINAAFVVQFITGLFGVLVLLLSSHVLLRLLNVPSALMEEAFVCLKLSAVGFFMTMVSGTYSSALLGLQNYDWVGVISSLSTILTTVAVMLVLVVGGTLVNTIQVSVVSAIVTGLVFFAALKYRLPFLGFHFPRSWWRVRDLLRYGMHVLLLRLSSVLNTYVIRFVISAYAGPAAVTYYVAPQRLVTAAQGAFGSLTGVLVPYASELHAKQQITQIQSLFTRGMQCIVALSVPIFFFLFFFSHETMTLWMGHEVAANSSVVLSFLALAYWLGVLTMIPANLALGIGKPRVVALFSSVVLALTIAAVIVLTKNFGLSGAAAGIFVAALQGPIFIWYVATRILQMKWTSFITPLIKDQWKMVVIFLACGSAIGFSYRAGWIEHWLISILAGLALVAVSVYVAVRQQTRELPLTSLRSALSRAVPYQ